MSGDRSSFRVVRVVGFARRGFNFVDERRVVVRILLRFLRVWTGFTTLVSLFFSQFVWGSNSRFVFWFAIAIRVEGGSVLCARMERISLSSSSSSGSGEVLSRIVRFMVAILWLCLLRCVLRFRLVATRRLLELEMS